MIAVPKIVLIVLLMFVVWYAVRWFNRQTAPRAVRRGPGAARSARPQSAVEDLVACRACGAYVAASARGCGKAGCPRPA
jgi:uncharacterized membrane-anchored protein